MRPLHPTQQQILALLRDNIDDPLTIRAIQEETSVSSPSVIHHHIKQLEKNGYLKRNPSNPKDYQILEDPEKPIVYINLYGQAQCGMSGIELDGNPEDRIPIASKLLRFPAGEAFMVKASGNSMSPKIEDGDYVIAQKSNSPKSGETVVCSHDGKVVIKSIQFDSKNVILNSHNSLEHPPYLANLDSFYVAGIVRSVFKY